MKTWFDRVSNAVPKGVECCAKFHIVFTAVAYFPCLPVKTWETTAQ